MPASIELTELIVLRPLQSGGNELSNIASIKLMQWLGCQLTLEFNSKCFPGTVTTVGQVVT
jgi:hypothetical protein